MPMSGDGASPSRVTSTRFLPPRSGSPITTPPLVGWELTRTRALSSGLRDASRHLAGGRSRRDYQVSRRLLPTAPGGYNNIPQQDGSPSIPQSLTARLTDRPPDKATTGSSFVVPAPIVAT